jgi:hypothetical protein
MTNTALALEFNNLGVICLKVGNWREAMELFKGASQLMNHIVANGEEETSNAADTTENERRTKRPAGSSRTCPVHGAH